MRASRLFTAAGALLKVGLPIVVGLAALGLLVAWVAGAFSEGLPAGQTTAEAPRLESGDEVYEVHEIIKPYFEEAIGTLKAARRTEISARIVRMRLYGVPKG